MDGRQSESLEKIRIVIVDDHGMVRKGLSAFLRNKPDLEVVGEARDGQEAVEQCERLQPDVVLMDLVMPKLNGVASTRRIHQQWPEIRVVALTSFEEKELVQDALQAGAISYLLKNVTGDDLASAIRAACMGQATLSPEAVQALIRPPSEESPPGGELTRREQEVLALMTKGLNNPEIADRMCVSRSTVKVHVSNVLAKLGVSNRAEAISVALQYRLVR